MSQLMDVLYRIEAYAKEIRYPRTFLSFVVKSYPDCAGQDRTAETSPE